jgi:thymidylate synthase (FAD)
MKVILVMSTPEQLIGECAKICYATKTLEEGGRDITHTLVHGKGHLAALRFAYATFLVEDISVACQNQVVRSKHLDFMVQSKRYVNADKGEFKFIYPEGVTDTTSKAILNMHWQDSINRYNMLLDNGVKKEDARAVLPANTSTKMYITGNLQGFMSYFKLRLNSHAQKEIRLLANKMWDLMKVEYPQVFIDELYEDLSR